MNFDLKYDDDFFSSNNELDYNCLPPEFHTSLNDFYVTKFVVLKFYIIIIY